jgi:hypothetical protein
VSLAAAVDCSSSKFNFFPEGRLNIPGGWNKANQTRAGNDCDGHLLPIAVQGIPKPLLHFVPVHSLLEQGAKVPAEYVPDAVELAAIIQAAFNEQQLRQHEALKAQLLQQQQQQQPPEQQQVQQQEQQSVEEELQQDTRDQALRKLQQVEDDSISKTQTINIRRAAGIKLQELLRLPKLPTVQLFGRSPAAVPTKTSSRMRQAKATRATSKQQTTAVPAASASIAPASNQQVEEPWRVTVPAAFEFTVTVNGNQWFKSKTFNGSSSIPEVNFNANVTEGRRDVFDPTIFKEVSWQPLQDDEQSSSSKGSSRATVSKCKQQI